MSLVVFRMTVKTRIFLFLFRLFDAIDRIGQWFIKHCDVEEG